MKQSGWYISILILILSCSLFNLRAQPGNDEADALIENYPHTVCFVMPMNISM